MPEITPWHFLRNILRNISISGSDPQTPTTLSAAFSTSSSLGKAVMRTKRTLPRSPTKSATVLAALVKGLTPTKRKCVVNEVDERPAKRRIMDRKTRADALTPEQISAVAAFFQRDGISPMCPGKKRLHHRLNTRRQGTTPETNSYYELKGSPCPVPQRVWFHHRI